MAPPTDHDVTRRAHREVLGLLATASSALPSAGLRDAVMERAHSVRREGEAFGAPDPITAGEAFAHVVADLDGLLGSLSVVDWGRNIDTYGWSVKGLVAHLTSIDRYLATRLGLESASFDVALERDHIEMTRADVTRAQGYSVPRVFSAWRAASSRLVARVGGVDADEAFERVKFHLLNTRLSTVLFVRVFEVWTHTDDIRRAVGRPIAAPSTAVLRGMSRVAVPAIPMGMLLRDDVVTGQVARVVLTGAGGGIFRQPLALGERVDNAAPASVTIVADIVDFCRLAAQRVRLDDIDVEFEGDADLGRRALAGAAVFAA